MYETDPLTLQASLYNGRGYKRFSGRENVFRFCPESDGVFAVAQAEYKYHDSHYFLGTSFHYGRLDGGARQVRPSFWTYAEQRVASDLSLMVAYSHDFQPSSLCRNFVGLGGKMDVGKAEVGLFSDYTRIEGVDEWATELTCRYRCSGMLSLQPTFFLIHTGGEVRKCRHFPFYRVSLARCLHRFFLLEVCEGIRVSVRQWTIGARFPFFAVGLFSVMVFFCVVWFCCSFHVVCPPVLFCGRSLPHSFQKVCWPGRDGSSAEAAA